MKHELKITNSKLSLKEDNNKIESDLKFENADLRSHLTKVTFELDSIKIEHAKLQKYNTIVKGELPQAKQHIENLYYRSEKINEQLFYHRPSYDKTGLGYFIGEKSAKKSIARKELDLVVETPKPKKNDLHDIELSKPKEVPKEVEQASQPGKIDEHK